MTQEHIKLLKKFLRNKGTNVEVFYKDTINNLSVYLNTWYAYNINSIQITDNLGNSVSLKHLDLIDKDVLNSVPLAKEKNLIKVIALKDESGDWYLVPNKLSNMFHRDDVGANPLGYNEFENKYGKYRTGGDLNCIQLYIEVDSLEHQNNETLNIVNSIKNREL